MRRLFLIILLIMILLTIFAQGVLIGGGIVFAYANRQQADLEAQYYRGLYDVCLAQTRLPEMCLNSVSEFKARDWYEQESQGWDWPLPEIGNQTAKSG